MKTRDVLVDIAAAAAGVAASWIVADLVVSAAERRRPLLADPRRLPEHFGDEHDRIQGVFHLALAIQDGMHMTYHARKVREKMAARHLAEGAHSVLTFFYHTAFAYVKHLRSYQARR